MKRALALTHGAILLGAASLAHADAYDCFPLCPEVAAPAAESRVNLCEVRLVREVAHVNDELKPVRQIYDIATNPTGYAIKLVDEHVVHIPKWVGYAMDPKGALRAEAMKRVREAAKKQVGLQDECTAPETVAEAEDTDFN